MKRRFGLDVSCSCDASLFRSACSSKHFLRQPLMKKGMRNIFSLFKILLTLVATKKPHLNIKNVIADVF
jgi:hypothetical protein